MSLYLLATAVVWFSVMYVFNVLVWAWCLCFYLIDLDALCDIKACVTERDNLKRSLKDLQECRRATETKMAEIKSLLTGSPATVLNEMTSKQQHDGGSDLLMPAKMTDMDEEEAHSQDPSRKRMRT